MMDNIYYVVLSVYFVLVLCVTVTVGLRHICLLREYTEHIRAIFVDATGYTVSRIAELPTTPVLSAQLPDKAVMDKVIRRHSKIITFLDTYPNITLVLSILLDLVLPIALYHAVSEFAGDATTIVSFFLFTNFALLTALRIVIANTLRQFGKRARADHRALAITHSRYYVKKG